MPTSLSSSGGAASKALQRAGDLVGLMGEPLGRALRRLAPDDLVALQHRGLGDAVRQRLPGQGLEAGLRFGRNHLAAARQPVEIFDDDGAVENRLAALKDQRRNFAQRILAPERIVRIVRVGGQDLDSILETEQRGDDQRLAGEGRGPGGAKDQHDVSLWREAPAD